MNGGGRERMGPCIRCGSIRKKNHSAGAVSDSIGPFERAGFRIAGALLFAASRTRPMPILMIIGVSRSRTRLPPHDLTEHRHLGHLETLQHGPGLRVGGAALHGLRQFRGELWRWLV